MANVTIKLSSFEHAELTRLANAQGMSRSGLLRSGIRQKATLEIVLDEVRKSHRELSGQIEKSSRETAALVAQASQKVAMQPSQPDPAPVAQGGQSEVEKLLRDFVREVVTGLFAIMPPEDRREEITLASRAVQRGEITQKNLALLMRWLGEYRPTGQTAMGYRLVADRWEKGA